MEVRALCTQPAAVVAMSPTSGVVLKGGGVSPVECIEKMSRVEFTADLFRLFIMGPRLSSRGNAVAYNVLLGSMLSAYLSMLGLVCFRHSAYIKNNSS